ncbi:hypothetical protein [Sphingopyxis indica]|uniref:Uncharacterized protein n=1 Tax=Sphingopyxis indica TaxID=436663 RepID=A0A239EP92_9SPHN|nr:hypothetical protein [Sphingopyxis indica]SNS45684.1 hypothetical protein SAMN06295955_101856 [Sphingopyxis indica]
MLTSAALILGALSVAGDAAPAPLPVAVPALSIEPPSAHFQVVIEQQLIIRVPARRSPLTNFSAPPAPSARIRETPIVWKEKKAPKCVAMRDIMGMQAVQRDSIDLITRQNRRLRAQLNRGCRALDFYAGFYMKGNKDGRLCEDRDEIHARTGARCEVDKFRLMVPVPRDDDD